MDLFIKERMRCIHFLEDFLKNINDPPVNSKKYQDFSKDYPKLWKFINKPNADIPKMILYQKNHLKKYRESNKTDHKEKQYEADKLIGEVLASQYLYNTYGKPSKDDKNKAESMIYRKYFPEKTKK